MDSCFGLHSHAVVRCRFSYTIQTVSFPGDNFTQLLGINDAGTIVGFHGATVNQGFTFTPPSTFTDTNFPNSAQTQVIGVSSAAANDNKVGFYVDTAGMTHGFISIPGLPAGIGPFFTVDQPGTAFNQVLGISSVGNRIAGYSSTDPTGVTLQQAYIGTAGLFGNTFTDINGLLPANQNSQATGINNAGNAVGFYLPTADTSIGFLDTGGIDQHASIRSAPHLLRPLGSITRARLSVSTLMQMAFSMATPISAASFPASIRRVL